MVVVCNRGYVFAQSRLPAAGSGGPGAASKVLYSREFRPEPSIGRKGTGLASLTRYA